MNTPSVGESIEIVNIMNSPRVSSVQMAANLGVDHKAVMQLIANHKEDFDGLGVLAFEMGKPQSGTTGGRPTRTAMLLEDQAYLLISMARNTSEARALKLQLIRAFRQARHGMELNSDPVLAQLEAATAMRRDHLALEARTEKLEIVTANMPILGARKGEIYRLGQELGRAMGNYRKGWTLFKDWAGIAGYADLPDSKYDDAVRFLNAQILAYRGVTA